MTAQVARHYAEVDGRQVHYRSAGDPSLPTLVLFHQSPSHSAMYEVLMETLAGDYHSLAPDSPGFGRSDSLACGCFDIEAVARHLQGWLYQVVSDPCLLFGHHTGAAIAVQLEHSFPGTAKALALSGPTLLDDAQRESLPGLATLEAPAEDGSHISDLWRRLRAKDPTVPYHISERELASALAAGPLYEASYRAVTEQDFAGQLPTLDCPVLVFAGDADPLYGAVEPSLQLLKHGTRAELAGGERTYVCERQADRVAGLLKDFFGELDIG